MPSDSNRFPTKPLAGAIDSYIHAGGKLGVLVELGCVSDFVAGTEDFLELIHDIAMQIAASKGLRSCAPPGRRGGPPLREQGIYPRKPFHFSETTNEFPGLCGS